MLGPNFGVIYGFIASLFDSSVNNHLEKLSSMNSVDRETLQLLMHNLAINLSSQQFRDQHVLMMDQYRNILSQPDSADYNSFDPIELSNEDSPIADSFSSS